MKIKEIRNICKKYSEAVFRMALSHMVAVGSDRLRSINVDEAVKEILASDNPKALITPQMQASILRCTCELAQQDLWDILAFVQTDICIQGVSVHPCIIVDVYEMGGQICTLTLPADTSEELIEEAAEEVRKTKPKYTYADTVHKMIQEAFRKRGINFAHIDEAVDIELEL